MEPDLDPGTAFKNDGNNFYKLGRYQDAIHAYSFALIYAFSPIVLSNRAQAYLKLDKHFYAHIDANEALKLDPKNVKAMHRLALAFVGLGFYSKAVKNFETCLELNEKNPEARKILEEIKDKKDDPKIEEARLMDYDPLESDAQAYGRRYFLADLNFYILHQRLPTDEEREEFKFDYKTWKPASDLNTALFDIANSLILEKNYQEAINALTLGLCYVDRADRLLQRAELHAKLKKWKLAYVDAATAFKPFQNPYLYKNIPEAKSKCLYFEALACKEMEKYDLALLYASESLHYDPKNEQSKSLFGKIVGSYKCESKKSRAEFPYLVYMDELEYDSFECDGPFYEKRKELHWNFRILSDRIIHYELIEKAEAALEEDRWEDAINLYSKVIVTLKTICPSPLIIDPELLFNRAQAYIEAYKREKREDVLHLALMDLNLALKLVPDFHPALKTKAILLAMWGFIDEAKDYMLRYISYEPNDEVAKKLLDNPKTTQVSKERLEFLEHHDARFADMGKTQEEFEIFSKPTHDLKDGIWFLENRYLNPAVKAFDGVVSKKPDPEAYYHRARAYLLCYNDLTKKALVDANNGLSLLEDSKTGQESIDLHVRLLRMKAIALWRLAKPEEAKQVVEELVKIDQRYADHE